MQDHELIRDHARDQRRRGLMSSTIRRRSTAVRLFSGWLGLRGVLAAIDEDVNRFLDGRRLGSTARYNWLSQLHVFYSWAISAGHTTFDPTADIVRPRLPQRLPRPISSADLAIAIGSSPQLERILFLCAALQGMRCAEIAQLTRADILDTHTPPMLVVHGKGNKERLVPLHPQVLAALNRLPNQKHGPVIRDGRGWPLQPWKVSHLAADQLRRLGIDASLHQARHWFGTECYRTSGRDLLMVAALMGHSSPTTTSIYAAFDRAGAPAAVNALAF